MIDGTTELERLVTRSRLIGADPTLVVHGGGNTSSKIAEGGRTVLRIKGSGTDLKTIGPDGFPGVYLDEVLPLQERDEMSDDDMVAYLAGCMVDPAARRGSIETLLHAFLPHRHIDHTHADAICVLTNQPDSEAVVHEVLGAGVAVVGLHPARVRALEAHGRARRCGRRGARQARAGDLGRDARAELRRHHRPGREGVGVHRRAPPGAGDGRRRTALGGRRRRAPSGAQGAALRGRRRRAPHRPRRSGLWPTGPTSSTWRPTPAQRPTTSFGSVRRAP